MSETQKTLKMLLRIGAGVARLTPTQADDLIVSQIEKLVDEPWFGEVLEWVLSLANRSDREVLIARLKQTH